MVTQNRNVQATIINPLQIHLGNHTRLIVERKQKRIEEKIEEKEESEMLCLKALLLSTIHEEEKVEEKEESETFCLKALLLPTIHLDRCTSRGCQHKGAPSPSTELWKKGNSIIRSLAHDLRSIYARPNKEILKGDVSIVRPPI